jgi:ankyrin repeat protein
MRTSDVRQAWVIAACLSVAVFGSPRPDSAVADAAMRNDIEAVRTLLREGADVNAPQGDGMTALHWAARHGGLEMTGVLLAAHASTEATTRLGNYTPLHFAGQAGHGNVVRRLLEAGSNVNAETSTGNVKPLHFAALAGSAEAVIALVEYGASVDATESVWGQTPLMFAAVSNQLSAVRALLEAGADIGVAATVVDISTREEEDRAAERRRNQLLASGRAAQASTDQRPAADRQEREASGVPEVPLRAQQLLGTTEIDPLSYADLVGHYGGLTALLLAVREGHVETVDALLDSGADVNQVSAGDGTSPLLMATINGHFDLAVRLLERGADVNLASEAGATPLYTTLNTEWGPKSRHPQPTDYQQQRIAYLDLMEMLLEAGADVNARLTKPLWYTTYNNDLLRVERTGATTFWRAAYATDVDAMRLLVSYGADPEISTVKAPDRRSGRGGSNEPDPSGLPPVPVGGPAVHPIHAASGAGYGQGYAANAHRHVPDGWLPAVRYLVEELGVDVNAPDHDGYNAVHHAAARGDNELILYLVEHGADVMAVSRDGETTVDMANGPVQRIQPFPETVVLLESLGARNNHNCLSC